MRTLNKQMIETERLRLRRWDNSDIHQIHLLLADPDVMQLTENGALNEPDQMAWLQRATTQRPKSALPACLAIERKQDSRMIGYVSLTQDLSRMLSDEFEPVSVCQKMSEPRRNKAGATRREQRRG